MSRFGTSIALLLCLALAAAATPPVLGAQQSPQDKVSQDHPADEAPPVPLEFWHVGNDALSNSLAEEVYTVLAAAQDFVPSTGKKQGSLLVEIPAGVTTKLVGKRNRVVYTVNYSTANDHPISTTNGSCPEKQLSLCAEQIVKGARIAARKVK